MKAHLKSKNSSWCFKKKTKNLYFDNPLGFIFQKKNGTTLVLKGKKTFFKNINLFEVKKRKLKDFFWLAIYHMNSECLKQARSMKLFLIYTLI